METYIFEDFRVEEHGPHTNSGCTYSFYEKKGNAFVFVEHIFAKNLNVAIKKFYEHVGELHLDGANEN